MSITTDVRRFIQRRALELVAGEAGLDRPLSDLGQLLIVPSPALSLSPDLFGRYRCIVFANGHRPTDLMRQQCDLLGLPLLCSDEGDGAIAQALARYLDEGARADESLESYPRIGTVVSVCGVGVMLAGPSGIGKSELALALLDRGHSLIVDDGPLVEGDCEKGLEVRCPAGFEAILEVRGVGLVDVRQFFGETAWQPSHRLDLIVELTQSSDVDERLAPGKRRVAINAVELPLVNFSVANRHNPALLLEVLVKQVLTGFKSSR